MSHSSSNSLLLYAEKRLEELLEHFHPSAGRVNTGQQKSAIDEQSRKESDGGKPGQDKKETALKGKTKEVGPKKQGRERKSDGELLQIALKEINLKRFHHMYKQFLLQKNSRLVIRINPEIEARKERGREGKKRKLLEQNKEKMNEKQQGNLKKQRTHVAINDSEKDSSASSINIKTISQKAKKADDVGKEDRESMKNDNKSSSLEEEEIVTIPKYGYVANHQIYIYHVFWVVASFGGPERLNRLPYFELWAKVADHKLIGLPKSKVSVNQSRGLKLRDFFYSYELDLFCRWLCGLTERRYFVSP